MIYLTQDGIEMWDTTNPQKEVDYNLSDHKVKIIGIDEV
jgi:hypothetical protein